MIRQKINKLKNIKNLIKQLDKIEKIKDNPKLLDKFILETKDNLICQELKVEMEIERVRLQNRSKKESKGDKKFALKLSKELQSAATASSIKEKNRINMYNNPKFKEFAEQKSFECKICYCERENFNDIVVMDKCNHYYCIDCMRTYLGTNIKDRKLSIKCPSDGCKIKFKHRDIKIIVTNDIFQLYEKFLLENTLGKDKECKFCPRPNCGMAMYSIGDNPLLVCPKCKLKFCFNCNTDEWHTGVTCKNFQKWLKKNGKAENSFEDFVKKRCKKCPRCKVNIQKNGGCNHMNCSHCGHHFQWNQLTAIPNVNENANYPNVRFNN